ncbi:MAG TPA: sortase [Candidatus Saccharimonadales bacterium]|nr:sortase [Candidatus Saccharimonadales bacterium]
MADDTTPTNDDKPDDRLKQAPEDLLDAADAQNAVDMIRDKVKRLYNKEPDARTELAEAEEVKRPSKHQQFMQALSESGKDVATIQTEWHNYYQSLPENEKHQVWQEFYESQPVLTGHGGKAEAKSEPQAVAKHKHQAAKPSQTVKTKQRKALRDARSAQEVQTAIRDKVSAGGKLQAKHHLQSLLFGLGVGVIVVIIFLFGFFNEVIIAPFIQPSRTSADTPLIVSTSDISPTSTPEVIIPKINVQIPVDYSQTTTDESQIENALEDGVVHYPTTVKPGQKGNAAFFGHSSNNIFNKGKYKFAFVLLHTLQNGDTFYLTYGGKLYVYKVISKTIVEPNQVSVLGPVAGQTATATLITCDPPGTSLHRLVVVGQQISPDPSGNTAATASSSPPTSEATDLPGNGPTLWSRYIATAWGKVVSVVVIALLIFATFLWVNAPKRHLQKAAKDRLA